MALKYSMQGYNKETMAKAIGKDISVSVKQSIEICSAIRRKPVQKVKKFLEEVIAKKTPVRYTRFNWGVGHRKGKGAAGRYPIKAAGEILNLVKSAEKNAQQKGLNSADLVIKSICADRASLPWRYGRIKRRKAKRTHIQIVLEERKTTDKKEKKEEPTKAENKEPVKIPDTKNQNKKDNIKKNN